MAAEIKTLSPTSVWSYFYDLTQIPRPTFHTQAVQEYLLALADRLGLEAKHDATGNILITKPATPGLEGRPVVTLQAHIDMVPQKNSHIEHDFTKDPIDAYIDGEWVTARDTTLGADNGIGAAYAMAVLSDTTLKHGPLEALFTVDEEVGMVGANGLQPGFSKGDILINLDSEDEGELFIGCAGGKGLEATFSPQWQPAPAGLVWLRAAVSGLKGGHSGGEIHCGLGNANKILTRYLYSLERELGSWSLAEIAGGNLHNAIPREAHALIGVRPEDKAKAEQLLETLFKNVQAELKRVDPKVRLELTEAAAPSQVIDGKTKYGLVRSLYACPHGVLGMSHEMEDLVETSNNLASIKQRDGKIVVTTSQRSSTTSLRDSASEMVASAFELGGAQVALTDAYPGWKPNPESAILKASADAYRKLFGKEAAVKAIHAGLECGLILDVYPDLDMVSFGPTLRDVHSPAERIEIKTVDLWWRHLLEVLKEIPVDK